MADSGVAYAYVKATEGSGTDPYINPFFDPDTKAARAAGLYTGAYAFGRPDLGDAVGQADTLVNESAWTADSKTLIPMLDLEWPYFSGVDSCYDLTSGQMTTWIRAFVVEVQKRIGRKPMIYTSASWWNQCTGSDATFGDYPLAIANWSDVTTPTLPAGWSDFTVWQYAEGSPTSGTYDRDAFNGDLAALSALATPLSSSDGSTSIRFAGGGVLAVSENVHEAAWSPDGSRAVFVTDAGGLDTVRYDHGDDVLPLVNNASSGVQRAHPTWSGSGSVVAWAERASETSPWRLMLTSTRFMNPIPISPDDGASYTHPDAGPGELLAFQRQVPGSPKEVWLYDPAAGSTPASRISKLVGDGVSDARDPALSPDGKKVAFVRSDGTHDQIWVKDLGSGVITQVTSNPTSHDNPTWSPTGNMVAFSEGSGVATAPADGSGADNPIPASELSGVPSYQPRHTDRLGRLAGADRFETAAAVSKSHWATAFDDADKRQPADAVVLSRSDTFADALSGSALAAAKQGPLLMTPPTELISSAKAEIQRVLAPGKTVYLLGSAGALSYSVEDQIKALGYNTVRLAGSDRFSTSIAIANAIDPDPAYILAATGMNFPDALAAGAAAGSYDVPSVSAGDHAVVVLTNDSKLPASTKSYLDAHSGSDVFGIGLQAASATSAYGPIEVYGSNRYETALYTARTFFGGSYYVGVATGSNWPDALAGGALMATLNGPLMLTLGTASEVSPETAHLLNEECGSIHTGLVFGSSGVVPESQATSVAGWISGPGGYSMVLSPTDVGLGVGGAAATDAFAKPGDGSPTEKLK